MDSGASQNLINASFVERHQLPTTPLETPISFSNIEGENLSCGPTTACTILTLEIDKHIEVLKLFITNTGIKDIVLGLPWFTKHNPDINWINNTICWRSQLCLEKCLVAKTQQTLTPIEVVSPEIFLETINKDVEPLPLYLCDISTVSTSNHSINSVSSDDATSTIPEELQQFANVFSEKEAAMLPPRRDFDHAIPLIPETKPKFGPIYALSIIEQQALQKYITENLKKGFIQPSQSPAASPILFVKKKDGSLRLCVDYRQLNAITIKNRYPLPLIPEILDKVSGHKVFSKIDLRGAYNLVRIKAGDEWKTAFRTRLGLYEYKVMPFGLSNAPASFQSLMDNTFSDLLDISMIAYLDDILVFTPDRESHVIALQQIFQRLAKANLYANQEKCVFFTNSIEFLGFQISAAGFSMSPDKIDAVKSWAIPINVKQVQSFLGFVNFYRRFIPFCSNITAILSNLTKKNTPFVWTSEHTQAFDRLKNFFSSSTFLKHFDGSQPCYVHTDASDYAIGVVISQTAEFRPVAYASRRLSDAEVNYDIFDKEFLAVVYAFRQFRHWLIGSPHTTTVFTDHANLQFLKTRAPSNRRQIRWLQSLADFDFNVQYIKGSANSAADFLSRPPVETQSIVATTETQFSDSPLLDRLKTAQNNNPKTNLLLTQLKNNTAPDTYELNNGLLTQHKKYFVPPDVTLQNDIVSFFHGHRISGHYGFRKTQELLSRYFYWPGLTRSLKQFLHSCTTCQQTKSSTSVPTGLLQPLPIPNAPWQHISLDFVVRLPLVSDFDSVLVVVDRFSKMAHFLPCRQTFTAINFATLFLHQIFRLHGLPITIVSDRDPRFTSSFWTAFTKMVNITRSLSTAYRPQTDGQTERTNRTLGAYLRAFCFKHPQQWCHFLPLAEFSYNNSIHTSTGQSPFFTVYGQHPLLQISSPIPATNVTAQEWTAKLDHIHTSAKACLKTASHSQKRFYDNKHRPPPEHNIGDLVWLTLPKAQQPTKGKLAPLRHGPFKIIQKISDNAWRLELPSTWKIHNTFHVSLLSPFTAPTHPSQVQQHQQQPASPPVVTNITPPRKIEYILQNEIRDNKPYQLVHYQGTPSSENEWIPVEGG